MFMRTEAMRSEAGCAVLTIASNTARFGLTTAAASPEGIPRAGASVLATTRAERIDSGPLVGAVFAGLWAATYSTPREMFPTRRKCQWHRRDETG
jgi:hypothetical protein